MRLSDALGHQGRRFSSTLLAELAGLNAFTLLEPDAEDICIADRIISAHLSYLLVLERKVEGEARQRAMRFLPPEAAIRLACGGLAKGVYASFRVYRVSFIEADLPELWKQVAGAMPKLGRDSTVVRFARALAILLDQFAAKTGEDLGEWFPDWRLRATVALCALIDLSGYVLTPEQADLLWPDGKHYDQVMSDIVPIAG
ncbi:hypothetical protein [Burkholderia sp. Ax-1724]|uniref:hypothetical protein n=1 Tax=Burkholderia sp. Ax-1724 TaxID=2608336 RepID=UPI0014230626|nr:hypothetical protein [Burkholderia sp. Ax-1724]NIF56681.1 hypothetical protein [Burkholderia sp. Ax-1724]